MDQKPLVERLEALSRSKPNADARSLVEGALKVKWVGVRVAAVRTLCAWGDPDSLALAKQSVAALARLKTGWAAVGAMANALAPSLSEADRPWLLDFLRQAEPAVLVDLRGLVGSLNSAEFRASMEALAENQGASRKAEIRRLIVYANNVALSTGA